MSKYRILMNGEQYDDLEYDTYEEACWECDICKNALVEGKEILELMGDVDDCEISDPDDVVFEIAEINEKGKILWKERR